MSLLSEVVQPATAAPRAGDSRCEDHSGNARQVRGMAANDGPVPVRTLAHAARLPGYSQPRALRHRCGEPMLDYRRRSSHRVREVVEMYARTRLSAHLKDLKE